MAYRDKRPEQRANLYQEITRKIIAELEAGRVPWVQPWGTARAAIGMPYNAASGRRYSGLNVLTLWDAVVSRGFSGHAFLTFRQAAALGGTVRRGERGIGIIYTHRFVPGEERRRAEAEGRTPVGGIPFLKSFTVFSVDQCEGLPPYIAEPQPPIPEGLILPQAEALIAATGADFRTFTLQVDVTTLPVIVMVPFEVACAGAEIVVIAEAASSKEPSIFKFMIFSVS